MSLRITSAAPAASASLAASGDSVDSAAGLGARARAMLAAGDIDAYRWLFAEAARLEDPQRCYHAQVVLLEHGLAAAAGLTSVSAAALRLAVADAAVQILEVAPREPVILNCAGLALGALGSLDAARALFGAVRRLDPALPQLGENLAAVRSRRRGRPARRPVQPALVSLARRATLAAGRARVVTGLTMSLCMIVRDEAQMLPRCLAAAAGAVDEIIIVDTGSQDATIEIARSFGARVIEHEWTDSFAQARNVSFAAATGDWLMFLDADEVLVKEDAEQLRALTGHTWREAFHLVETSYAGEADDGFAATTNALRVFRNRPQYRFEGRLHEQIAHTLPVYAPGRIEQTSIRIRHYGYLKSVRDAKGKYARNVELLRARADERPADSFLHFNLGSEHAAVGDAASALPELERAWAMIVAEGDGANYEYVPALIARLIEAMRRCGRPEDAASLAAEGLRRYPAFTDLVFSQGNMALAIGDGEAARSHYHRCIELGDAPARYRPIVGCGTFLPRISLAEMALHDGDRATALELLDWCIERYPTVVGVVAPYASLLLDAGVTAGEAVAEIERRVSPLSATARLTLGAVLQRAGALEAAQRQYRSVITEKPDSDEARVALAAADRIQLCGLIAGGDLQAASEALIRVPLSAVEREVFGVWLALVAGAPSRRSLSVAAAPVLEVILETLLAARRTEAVKRLLPALEGSAVPARQRRELLGGIYLRHGLLAEAAGQWMAVCEAQPDAAALVGLAHVALARAQPQDAAVFATGARELEPGNVAAAELLARAHVLAAAVDGR